jgi:hypothetical protein
MRQRMNLGTIVGMRAIGIGGEVALNEASSLVGEASIVVVVDSQQQPMAVVFGEVLRRWAQPMPHLPLRLMPSVSFTEASEAASVAMVRAELERSDLDLVVCRAAQGWRAISLRHLDDVVV